MSEKKIIPGAFESIPNCGMFPKGKAPEENIPRCPKCGRPNKCGVAVGKSFCWCKQHPPLENISESDTCFCEPCFLEELENEKKKE